jgi:hypothetical protein
MAESDRIKVDNNGLSWRSADDITPHDSTELTKNYLAFIIDSTGSAGTIALEFDDGTTLSIDALIGVEYQYTPKFVKAIGTTATGIKGLV